jgi:hypothetical protein
MFMKNTFELVIVSMNECGLDANFLWITIAIHRICLQSKSVHSDYEQLKSCQRYKCVIVYEMLYFQKQPEVLDLGDIDLDRMRLRKQLQVVRLMLALLIVKILNR